ncbi:MAG TPA: GAF domain-containing protein [Candidatus Saccharimonadia bacterium]|nr:GAF domain-containing protein [Candidatus Saccharimonadia bacterium]
MLAAYAAYALRHDDRAALFRRTVRSAAVALRADGTELVCVDPEAARRVAAWGLAGQGLGACETPLSRYVVRHGAPVISTSVADERRFLVSSRWRERGMASLVSVPFAAAPGSEQFVLTAYAKQPHAFSDEHLELARAFADVLDAALARRRESRDAASILLEHFAGVLAHEVRNPLNALAMNAEVASMLLGSQRGDDVPKVLERVGRDIRRCSAAIRELSAVVARDVPDEGIALDELLGGIAERLREQSSAGPAIEVELGPVDERLSYAGNIAAIDFALSQMARTIIARGVDGVRIGVVRDRDGYEIEVERLARPLGAQQLPASTLSPTRIAAYALARHALETAGARVRPETLHEIPERCRIHFPAPAIHPAVEA